MKNILDVIRIESQELTEQELDAVYMYLNMEFNNMNEEEKIFWFEILKNIDKDFYEDQNSGTV